MTSGNQTYLGNVNTVAPLGGQVTLMGGDIAVSGDLDAQGKLTMMGGDVTVVGAFTSGDEVALKGVIMTVVNPNNDFGNASFVRLDATTVDIVDANLLQVGGEVTGDLNISVGNDDQGNSLNFDILTVDNNLFVSATGKINQIGEVNVTGLTDRTSTQGVINLNIDEKNFIDVVTLTGDEIIISTKTDLKLGDIVTTSPTSSGDPKGTFTINASANVSQLPNKTIKVNRLKGSVRGDVSVILFNEGSQINEIGDITLTDGGNFYLRDNGRQAGSFNPAALVVNGEITGEGSLWLVVDGATNTDREGITFTGGGSILLDSPVGSSESLLLIGGLNDTNGLSGTAELLIPDNGSNTRVSATGGTAAYLLFNTVNFSNGSSDLTGINVGGREGDFQSINFSFNPDARVAPSGDADLDLLLAGRIDSSFEGDLGAVIDDSDPDRSKSSFLTPLFRSRVPRFIDTPSFLITLSAPEDTDTASQAGDVATLTRSFFDDLENIGQVTTLTAEEIAEISAVARFGGRAGLFAYGPFAILSYEYDRWLLESGQKPGVEELEEDKKIYGGVYPLYLRLNKDDKPVPVFED